MSVGLFAMFAIVLITDRHGVKPNRFEITQSILDDRETCRDCICLISSLQDSFNVRKGHGAVETIAVASTAPQASPALGNEPVDFGNEGL